MDFVVTLNAEAPPFTPMLLRGAAAPGGDDADEVLPPTMKSLTTALTDMQSALAAVESQRHEEREQVAHLEHLLSVLREDHNTAVSKIAASAADEFDNLSCKLQVLQGEYATSNMKSNPIELPMPVHDTIFYDCMDAVPAAPADADAAHLCAPASSDTLKNIIQTQTAEVDFEDYRSDTDFP